MRGGGGLGGVRGVLKAGQGRWCSLICVPIATVEWCDCICCGVWLISLISLVVFFFSLLFTVLNQLKSLSDFRFGFWIKGIKLGFISPSASS